MRELSLNILDIAENSVKAGAELIEISVIAEKDDIAITIKDNGCGMDADFLKRVCDPFTTTRTTRKVGMGIPLLKMEAEMSGGSFTITSEKNVGTIVTSSFKIDNIDRPPLGDVADTLVTLISDPRGSEIRFIYRAMGECEFILDTREIKKELGGVPISEPEVLIFIREMINENIKTKFLGVSL